MFVLADVCADLGDAENAEIIYGLLGPYAHRNALLGNVYTYGSVAFSLGRIAMIMGRQDAAEAHFETAIAANRRIRAAVWLAHAQHELGRALAGRNKKGARTRAKDLIASARHTATALGLVRLGHKLQSIKVEGERATTPRLIEGVAAIEAHSAVGGGSHPREADSFGAVVSNAISRARDLGAQASFEGTVTILFSDIEDSSSLYERLGDLRAHDVVRVHNEIVRQQIAAHRGVEVKALGDSFMVAFPSARRAALCAIDTQRSFAAYCESHPNQPMRVRMGLHVGEAINESADFFGKTVILAARIAALARGGQILVSSTLRDLTMSAGDIRFASIGEKKLKGLAGTHHIFEISSEPKD